MRARPGRAALWAAPAWMMVVAGSAAMAGPADAGRPAAHLRQGLGARALALGRAYGAEAGDAVAFLYNPAASAGLEGARLALQQGYLPVEREMQCLAAAWPGSGAQGSLFYGGAFTRMSLAKPIERRQSDTPEPLYTFGETRYSAHAAVALAATEAWSMGLGFHYHYHQLAEAQGSGYGFDLGGRWRPLPWLRAGLAIQDALAGMGWNTGSAESLPLATRESVSLPLRRGLVVDGELEQVWAERNTVYWRLGAEWTGFGGRLALRGGLDSGRPALGLGFLVPWQEDSWRLDYALAGEEGASGWLQHRFSLGLDLGEAPEGGAR